MRYLLTLMLLCGCSIALADDATCSKCTATVMIPVGSFGETELKPVQDKADELVTAGAKQLIFSIDSNGGVVDSGFEFISHIKNLKKKGVRVSCVVDWKAYSMAASFLEGACDDRWAAPNASLMFHEASTGVSGKVRQLEDEAAALGVINHALAVTNASRIGMPTKDYEAKLALHDWWLSADDALKAHVIDEIRDPAGLPPLAELKAPEVGIGDLLKLLGGKRIKL